MGEQYAQPSGTVMQILLLSVVFSSANTTSGGIVYGMEKHKRIALWAMARQWPISFLASFWFAASEFMASPGARPFPA